MATTLTAAELVACVVEATRPFWDDAASTFPWARRPVERGSAGLQFTGAGEAELRWEWALPLVTEVGGAFVAFPSRAAGRTLRELWQQEEWAGASWRPGLVPPRARRSDDGPEGDLHPAWQLSPPAPAALRFDAAEAPGALAAAGALAPHAFLHVVSLTQPLDVSLFEGGGSVLAARGELLLSARARLVAQGAYVWVEEERLRQKAMGLPYAGETDFGSSIELDLEGYGRELTRPSREPPTWDEL